MSIKKNQKEELRKLKYEAKKALALNDKNKAKQFYEKILKISPKDDAILNYVWCLIEENNLEKAQKILSNITSDNNFDAYYLMGVIKYYKKEFDEALVNFKKTIEINSDFELAYRDIFDICLEQKNIIEAENIILKAIEKFETNTGFLNRAANLYGVVKKDYKQSLDYYVKEFTHQPIKNKLDAFRNIKKIISEMDSAEEVIIFLEDFIKNYVDNNINFLNCSDEINNSYLLVRSEALSNIIIYNSYMENFSYEKERIYLKRYSDNLDNFIKKNSINKIKNKEKIKLGFISAQFTSAPTSLFLFNLLKYINKDIFDVYILNYTQKEKFDKYTKKIKESVKPENYIEYDKEHYVSFVINKKMDILIELDGHTCQEILLLMSNRVAPIQLSWLGYWGYTGVKELDYILLDKYSIRKEDEIYFDNKVKYIKESRLNLLIDHDLVDEKDGDHHYELAYDKNNFITFGCLQNLKKINNNLLKAWADIYRKNNNVKFVLRNGMFNNEKIKEEYLKKLNDLGIPAENIEILPSVNIKSYMKSITEIDILLDTYPFNGGTTTIQALYMGVPTITCRYPGSIQGNQGNAIMSNVGLENWIANDLNEYVDIAVTKSKNIEELRTLRKTLRKTLLDSSLGNGEKFSRNFEELILEIWNEKINKDSE